MLKVTTFPPKNKVHYNELNNVSECHNVQDTTDSLLLLQ